MPSGQTKKAVRAFVWLFTGTGLMSALRILVVIFLARLLVPRDFGLLGAGLLVISFSELLAKLGVGSALVQLEETDPKIRRTGFTLSLILAAVVTLPLWFGAPTVAAFFRMPDLAPVVRWLTALLPLNALAVVATAMMERELRFRRIAIVETAAFAVGYAVVSLVLAVAGLGVWALVTGTLTHTALRTVLFLAFQPHEKKPLLDRDSLRRLMRLTGGFALTRVGAFFSLQGDNLVVGRWLGGEALGFYTRAYALAAAPVNLLARALGRVLFPTLAQVQQDKGKVASAFQRTLAMLALATLPLAAALVFIGPELIDVLLGAGWTAAIVPFQILAIGLFVRSAHKICAALASAMGAVYRLANLYALYALMILAGAWLGHRWGLPGVAVAVLGAGAAHLLLMTGLCLSLTGLTWRELARSLTPAAVYTGAIIAILGPWTLFTRASGVPQIATLAGAAAALAGVYGLFYWVASVTTFGKKQQELIRLLIRRNYP